MCNNFEKDPLHEKLDEIRQKYNYRPEDADAGSGDDPDTAKGYATRDKNCLPKKSYPEMGIPTTRSAPKPAKAKSQPAEGAGIPMKGEMSKKF